MPKKIIICNYEGKTIKITNTWFNGLTLYIDDKFITKNNDLFSVNGTIPIVKTNYRFDSGEKLIEIFCKAIFTVKIKICINGQIVGGELF